MPIYLSRQWAEWRRPTDAHAKLVEENAFTKSVRS
jgi:hypothetical protein